MSETSVCSNQRLVGVLNADYHRRCLMKRCEVCGQSIATGVVCVRCLQDLPARLYPDPTCTLCRGTGVCFALGREYQCVCCS